MTHTAEPWVYRPEEHDDWGIIRASVTEQGRLVGPIICQISDPDARDELTLSKHRAAGTDPWEANARRVVDCVNACAGIPDPAQLRADRDALLEALGKVDDCITDLASEARLPIMDFAAANPELGDLLLEIRPLISRIRGESE